MYVPKVSQVFLAHFIHNSWLLNIFNSQYLVFNPLLPVPLRNPEANWITVCVLQILHELFHAKRSNLYFKAETTKTTRHETNRNKTQMASFKNNFYSGKCHMCFGLTNVLITKNTCRFGFYQMWASPSGMSFHRCVCMQAPFELHYFTFSFSCINFFTFLFFSFSFSSSFSDFFCRFWIERTGFRLWKDDQI